MGNKPSKAEKQAAREAQERDIAEQQAKREQERLERLEELQRKRVEEGHQRDAQQKELLAGGAEAAAAIQAEKDKVWLENKAREKAEREEVARLNKKGAAKPAGESEGTERGAMPDLG